ncbi:AAA family ATPase [Muribaculaceae bacterium Isolate-004 (NCI)]|uniref:AAA family ATPase n=1 Tax=Paramuribaculum intestinale TaxID=2094151 RepID=UPI000FFECB8E|nr:ATP-binding protein [Paramuribaculum intestinale]RXE63501.1 AAA family ATPase [Muribaculaceae bacterium Isolate-004 (NCI)]
MARADLILDLIKNSYNGNKYQFKKVVEALIAEERSKQHTILADRLQKELDTMLRSADSDMQGRNMSSAAMAPVVNNFLQEVPVRKSFDDLVLPTTVKKITEDFFEEHFRSDILRSYGLEPRHKIILSGNPGTGKTSFAEALAERLMVPLYMVRYDALIGSYLGETAMRLRQLFDFVSSRKCILFFDEFDTIGKERGDIHELGEIKRVVSSLLLMTDSLPSYTIVIGASNHAELLDRAVWRRFQIRIELPIPDSNAVIEWLKMFEKKNNISFQVNLKNLAASLKGRNFGDIEIFAQSVMRRYVLSLPNSDIASFVKEELKKLELNIS